MIRGIYSTAGIPVLPPCPPYLAVLVEDSKRYPLLQQHFTQQNAADPGTNNNHRQLVTNWHRLKGR